MPIERSILGNERVRRWLPYYAKAAALFVLLLAFASFGPLMPPVVVAVVWAALSIGIAIATTYHVVLLKVLNQPKFEDGSVSARINSGRTFAITGAFIVAALAVACLMLESPKWGFSIWLVVGLSVPLYPVVYWVIMRLFKHQFKPLFRRSNAILWGGGVVGVLLCVAYGAICLVEPAASYTNATAAFDAMKQPFAESPSCLLSEVGKLVALVDGLTAYAVSKAAAEPFGFQLVMRVIISASAFFGVAGLLGACMIRTSEARAVFLPLEAAISDDAEMQPVKWFVVIACVLPLVLVAAFLIADWQVSRVVQTEEYTAAEETVRSYAGLAAYVIDGKYYDCEKVEDLVKRAEEMSRSLAEDRQAVLTPLINQVYDQRIQNVDSYLDWYYSLPADYERLVQFFMGTVEEGMRKQLAEKLNENIDEEALNEQFNYYLERAKQQAEEFQDELQKCEIADVPDWLIVSEEPLNADFLNEPLEPTQSFLDASSRMGLSLGVGALSGVIAAKVTKRVLAKPFFKKIVAEVLEKLAARGLATATGTMVAPGVGTGVGFAIGTGTDFLLLKADEAANRASYRDEIVAAIEESRQEALDLVSVKGE